MPERMSADMWAMRKALVLALEIFREKNLMSKIMFAVALSMGMVPFVGVRIVMTL